jgi:transposase InsO family protein
LVRLLPKTELLNGEIFYSLGEAKVVIEGWRRHYNTLRPHSSLGYRPPASEVLLWPAAQPGPASPATPAVALRPVMH